MINITAECVRYYDLQFSNKKGYIGLILQMSGLTITTFGSLYFIHARSYLFADGIQVIEKVDRGLSKLGVKISYKVEHITSFIVAAFLTCIPISITWVDRSIYKKILDLLGYYYSICIRLAISYIAIIALWIVRRRFSILNAYIENLIDDGKKRSQNLELMNARYKLQWYLTVNDIYENLLRTCRYFVEYYEKVFLLYLLYNYVHCICAVIYIVKGYSSEISKEEVIILFIILSAQLMVTCILATRIESQVGIYRISILRGLTTEIGQIEWAYPIKRH